MKAPLLAALLLIPSLACAQPVPDPTLVIVDQWTAARISQGNLLRSIQDVVHELEAARVKINDLTEELAKSKKAQKVEENPAPADKIPDPPKD